MKLVSFHETIENIKYSTDYHYLLNFWYISKLNKELEFIKRNGIHPDLKNSNSSNSSYNALKVDNGNSIQTYFYTAFRIFLKSFFKNSEAFKTRDKEEWKISFLNEKNKLNNPILLILKFNANFLNNSNDGLLKPSRSGYSSINTNIFYLRLSNDQRLHAKHLIDKIAELEDRTVLNIDDSILTSVKTIGNKLDKVLGISETKEVKKAIAKVVFKKKEILVNGWERIDNIANNVARPLPQENLSLLLPFYHQLKAFTNVFPDRTKYSYILSFAKMSSPYNPEITGITDNEESYLRFIELTNNFTL